MVIDWEVVYSDVTDWGRFGRAPNLSERKSEDEGGERYDGVAEDDADVKDDGLVRGSVLSRPHARRRFCISCKLVSSLKGDGSTKGNAIEV